MRLPPAGFSVGYRAVIPFNNDHPGIVHVKVLIVRSDLCVYRNRAGIAKQESSRIQCMDSHICHGSATSEFFLREPAARSPMRMHTIAFGAYDSPQLL